MDAQARSPAGRAGEARSEGAAAREWEGVRAARIRALEASLRHDGTERKLVVRLRIAGLVVGLRLVDPTYTAQLLRALTPFVATDHPEPLAWIDLTIDGRPEYWRDTSPEPRVVLDGGEITIEHRDFAARIEGNGRRMRALQPRRLLSTENALRVLLALLLVRADGLLLHAAGVLRGEGASAFFGPSGCGKTTLASLARGRALLGDDLVALRRVDDGWYAHATPFNGGAKGRQRRPRSAPLTALFRLRQGIAVETLPLSGAGAVAELLQASVLPAALPGDRALALERCASLQSEPGVLELTFAKDPGLWRWLDEHGF